MRRIKYLLSAAVLLLTTLTGKDLLGQTESYNMVNGDTLYITICSQAVRIYDDGGPNGSYSNNFDGWVMLYTDPGATISLTGTQNTENSWDKLYVYDGGSQIFYGTGSVNVNASTTSGEMLIHFHTDGSVTRSGFELTATTSAPPANCSADISGFTVSNVTSTTAHFSWSSSTPVLMFSCGDIVRPVMNGSFDATGLSPNTAYTAYLYHPADSGVACCMQRVRFRTAIQGGHGCVDPTDLASGYTVCYYGTFSNPYSSVGIVNNGSAAADSRHTVHTNPNERDPRTGNQLRTVPAGSASSVRLGNWSTSSQAEAILYAIEVDTLVSDLLLLKYAAVLEDPNHNANEQPRFKLELLNTQMELIDPTCGVADFIADASLGWNTYGSDVLWKDWTAVGIDLAPYAGQTIYVRLTTYDCSQGAHYGYAYFTLECGHKKLESEYCGSVTNNVFTAPLGFNYLWYTDSPSHPAGTGRTLNVSTDTTVIYHCRLSFVDNPSCYFVMSAVAGTRYPLALFDSVVTRSGCEFDVDFINHSTISADGETPSGTGENCEAYWWDFGNGQTSTDYNTSAHYSEPGVYTVTLVAYIGGGQCTDTLTKTLTLTLMEPHPSLTGPDDRCIGDRPDTLTIHNATWTSWTDSVLLVSPENTATFTAEATDSNGCLYHLSHTINVHPTYMTSLVEQICDDTSYTFADSTFSQTGVYTMDSVTAYGCDSSWTLQLTVLPTYETTDSSAICPYGNFTWNGTDYGGPVEFDTVFTVTGGCDSLVHVKLVQIDSSFILSLLVSDDSATWSSDTLFMGCLPYTIYLKDLTPQEAWRMWQTGDGDSSSAAALKHVYEEAGVYNLTLTATSTFGCRDSITLKDAVWVFANPTAAFDWDEKLPAIHNAETQFINLSSPHGLDYLWEISTCGGGTDTSTEENPHFRWGEPNENTAGNYPVQLIAYWTHEGPDSLTKVCTDTIRDTVVIVNDFLQFPNLVTPNGDGYNDTWEVVNLVEMGVYSLNELWIFNQWGVLVFHARNIYTHDDFWDPNATNSPDGTYYYRFAAESRYGVVKRNGPIEVLRGN